MVDLIAKSFHGMPSAQDTEGRKTKYAKMQRDRCPRETEERRVLVAQQRVSILFNSHSETLRRPISLIPTSLSTSTQALPPPPFPFFNSSSITPFKLSGFVVLAHRFTTAPSLPIKNFSKFHFTRCKPIKPGLLFFIHSHTGSTPSPLTSVLPSTGNETP